MGESQRRPNGSSEVLGGTTPHECCGTTQIGQRRSVFRSGSREAAVERGRATPGGGGRRRRRAGRRSSSAARARLQRAQRPLAGGVVEPPVADEARPHGSLAAGCYRQRRGTGVVPAGLRRVVAFGVIPELVRAPGRRGPHRGRAGNGRCGVRVLLKRGRELGLELLERRLISLICPTAARVLAANALLTAGVHLELRGKTQRLADSGGAALDAALAAAAPEFAVANLGDAQPRRPARIRARWTARPPRRRDGKLRAGLGCTRMEYSRATLRPPVGLADVGPR